MNNKQEGRSILRRYLPTTSPSMTFWTLCALNGCRAVASPLNADMRAARGTRMAHTGALVSLRRHRIALFADCRAAIRENLTFVTRTYRRHLADRMPSPLTKTHQPTFVPCYY